MLTQAELKRILHYDPRTGFFTWRVKIARCLNVGARAGGKGSGYVIIGIYGNHYLAHRLVFLYLYGSLPRDQTDHIDGNPLNNARSNLRQCSHATNMKNQKLPISNTSGIIGVSWDRKNSMWQVSIRAKGKLKFIGRFHSKVEAALARKKAEVKHQYHRNHGRV